MTIKTAAPAPAEAAAPAEGQMWEARLVRGTRYVFRGKHYLREAPAPGFYVIDDETKLALERKAVDELTIDGSYEEDGSAEIEYRQKFSFNKVGEAPALPSRRRVRNPAA